MPSGILPPRHDPLLCHRGLKRMPPHGRARILAAVMLLAAALAYANGLTGDFIWDDRNVVVENTRAHGLSHLPELLGWGEARFGFRLVRDLSYAVDYSVGGLSPVVYHVSNVLYHMACTFLVWVLARRLGAGAVAAFWAGTVFAVHPVHVDAVTYIAGRRDLLSTAFYLGGLLAFARYRDGGRTRWLAAAGGLGLLGMMAKEMAGTLPLAWFLYDAWRLAPAGRLVAGARRAVAAHWRLYGAGGLAAAAFVAYAVLAQDLTHGAGPYGGAWGPHAMSEAVILAYGLKLLLFPMRLIIDYQHFIPPVMSPLEPRFLGAAALLAAVAGGAWAAFRGRRTAAFAAHWVWVTYLPVMQILPHPERFAEHYLYLPSVGACLLFGLGIERLAVASRLRRPVLALAGAVVVLLAARTLDRNRDFADEVTVFEAASRVHPRAARVWNNLALAYDARGERTRAIALLTDAVARNRDPLLAANLAQLLGKEGRWREAAAGLLAVYALEPTHPRVLRGLGDAFTHLDRPADARRFWGELLAVEPGNPVANLELGNLARAEGHLDEAAARYRAVIRRKPDGVGGWTGLGVTLHAQGDLAGARAAFERVLELDPADGDAWNNLGILALQAGDPAEAEADFARATAAARVPGTAWLNLARVRLERGDCDGALEALRTARRKHADLPPAAVATLRPLVQARCAPGGGAAP
jgi:Flp pilus assembly protein TadD